MSYPFQLRGWVGLESGVRVRSWVGPTPARALSACYTYEQFSHRSWHLFLYIHCFAVYTLLLSTYVIWNYTDLKHGRTTYNIIVMPSLCSHTLVHYPTLLLTSCPPLRKKVCANNVLRRGQCDEFILLRLDEKRNNRALDAMTCVTRTCYIMK